MADKGISIDFSITISPAAITALAANMNRACAMDASGSLVRMSPSHVDKAAVSETDSKGKSDVKKKHRFLPNLDDYSGLMSWANLLIKAAFDSDDAVKKWIVDITKQIIKLTSQGSKYARGVPDESKFLATLGSYIGDYRGYREIGFHFAEQFLGETNIQALSAVAAKHRAEIVSDVVASCAHLEKEEDVTIAVNRILDEMLMLGSPGIPNPGRTTKNSDNPGNLRVDMASAERSPGAVDVDRKSEESGGTTSPELAENAKEAIRELRRFNNASASGFVMSLLDEIIKSSSRAAHGEKRPADK